MSCDDPLVDDNDYLPKIGTVPLSDPVVNIYAVADCNGNPLPLGSKITVGTNAAISVGNQHDYNVVNALADTAVKISINVGSETKDLTLYTAP